MQFVFPHKYSFNFWFVLLIQLRELNKVIFLDCGTVSLKNQRKLNSNGWPEFLWNTGIYPSIVSATYQRDISQEVHDQRARLTWRRSIQLRRRNINHHNLYARRTDRDNETTRKKGEAIHRRLKERDREWQHVVIYDGNCKRLAELSIRCDISRLFLHWPPEIFTFHCKKKKKKKHKVIAIVDLHSRGDTSVSIVYLCVNVVQNWEMSRLDFSMAKTYNSNRTQF